MLKNVLNLLKITEEQTSLVSNCQANNLWESWVGKSHIQAVLILRAFVHLANGNLVLTVLCVMREIETKGLHP